MNKLFYKYLFAFVIPILSVPTILNAQSLIDDTDFQSWNDLQITVPITKKLDLYTVTTVQFHGNLSNVDNVRFGAGVTVKPTKNLSITPFVTFLSDRNALNRFRYEYRYTLRGVYRLDLEHFTVGHRSQVEYRVRPARNTWRYRPMIYLEAPVPNRFVPRLKAFVTEEPFYDSASGRFSRNRVGAGVNKTLNKRLSLDLYFLHQGDNHSRPGSVNVLGSTLKLKL